MALVLSVLIRLEIKSASSSLRYQFATKGGVSIPIGVSYTEWVIKTTIVKLYYLIKWFWDTVLSALADYIHSNFLKAVFPKFYLVHYWILGLIYHHFHYLHGTVVRSMLPFGQNTASSHYSEIFPVSILVCIYTIKNQRVYVKLTQMRSWRADVGILVVIFVRFVVFFIYIQYTIFWTTKNLLQFL